MKYLAVMIISIFSFSAMGADKKDDCIGKVFDKVLGTCKPIPAAPAAPAPEVKMAQAEVPPVVNIKADEPIPVKIEGSTECDKKEPKEPKEKPACKPCKACKACKAEKECKPVIKTVTKTVKVPIYVDRTVDRVVEKIVDKKNRLSLVVGTGPDALNYRMQGKDGRDIQIRKDYGIFFGVRYERLLTESVSAGVEIMTNESGAASLGYNW